GKRRDGALRSLAEIEESERDLADRLETFARRIGLREPVGVDSLQWLLERIRRWQEANDAAHGAFAAAETARTQLVAQLGSIGEKLERYGYAGPETLGDARDRVRSLQARYEAWRDASRLRAAGEEELRRRRGEIADAEE